ncbi:MAG: biotin--[acetyl-CoA-carboxylase] ligase [Aeromicrobium erythreum]
MDASTSAPTPDSAAGTPTPDRPPLDVEELRRALLVGGGLWTAVEVSSTTASTNADVVAAVAEGAPRVSSSPRSTRRPGAVGSTDAGRRPPRSGLVVSVLLRPDAVALPQWTWLPLLAGIAVDLTARDCGVASGLKWPNDVLVDGRKLCGILVERAEGPAGAAAVLGIGLNLTLTQEELPVPTATSFALAGAATTDRGVVLQILLGHLERLYRRWVAGAGDPTLLRADYLERCVTLGSTVQVDLPDGSVLRGRADDVDPLGRLVVAGRAISAGDVTHVRPTP